ncbi:MAG: hypothetical protein QME87_09730 [Bacillota bacterium]|nr:hypothetical protein [Bacillota bacterium]
MDNELRDYVERYVEYSAFAARVSELAKEQQELELQEQALEAQAEILAAGRAKGWGVKERKRAFTGGKPSDARPAGTPAPHLVPTHVQFADEGSHDAPTSHGARLAELARQKGWEEQVALRNTLTCAFALQRLATLQRDQIAKESAVLGRQSAVLRYRTWVLVQDNRIIQMHLGGLRARVARLSTLADRPPGDTQ